MRKGMERKHRSRKTKILHVKPYELVACSLKRIYLAIKCILFVKCIHISCNQPWMTDKCTWPNVMIKLHTARKPESTEKLMSPQALTTPLRSLFAMYTANQPSG